MFDRAAITLGIGPHSSLTCFDIAGNTAELCVGDQMNIHTLQEHSFRNNMDSFDIF